MLIEKKIYLTEEELNAIIQVQKIAKILSDEDFGLEMEELNKILDELTRIEKILVD